MARSPAYPAINLDEAIERAKTLWDHEARSTANVDVIAEHFGFSPGSGSFNTVISAMRKFGLVEYEGTGDARAARLTDLAIAIVTDDREEAGERHEKILEAALMPKIHRTIYESYPNGLPSDSNLRYALVNEFDFTETGASDFVSEVRQTFDFAGVYGQEGESEEAPELDTPPAGEGKNDEAPPVDRDRPAHANDDSHSREARSVHVPLPGGDALTVTGPFPLNKDTWTYALTVLEAMSHGLTTETE